MGELHMYREEHETWREAAARQARKYGLEHEVLEIFDAEVKADPEKDQAEIAWGACFEWDVLDLTASISEG